MLGHDDGGKSLMSTLEEYTEAANGKRADAYGKTVFPAKNFSFAEPLCEIYHPALVLCVYVLGRNVQVARAQGCPVLPPRPRIPCLRECVTTMQQYMEAYTVHGHIPILRF